MRACVTESVCVCANGSLVGHVDAERVRGWNDEAHRGNHHLQTPRSGHQPLAALRVILHDGLVSLEDALLWSTQGRGKSEHIGQVQTQKGLYILE